MSDTDLVMYRGDDRSWLMTMTDGGVPVNLTAASMRFTAKRKVTDADADAVITLTTPVGIEIVDGPAGQYRIRVPRAATVDLEKETTLVWDVQAIVADETRTVPEPSLEDSTLGSLLVRLDVSRTNP